MKILRIIFIMILVLMSDELAAQTDWQVETKSCNGNEYIVEHTEFIYAITNKKYDFAKSATRDIEFDGERIEDFENRRYPLREQIYNVANGIFNFAKIPVPDDDVYVFAMQCFFDSQSKDYVGAYFVFDVEIKDYITLEKLNLLESKLHQAKINTGRTNLLDNEKYFTIAVEVSVGE